MLMVVGMEILTMYIMLMYLNEMDSYSVMVMIGIGMCLLMGSGNGWISLMVMVMMWPMFVGYMEWIAMWVNGLKVGETWKKMVVIVLMMSLILINVGLLYVVVLSIGVYGMSSVVALSVYGWLMLGGGMTVLMVVYLSSNIMIELNWKMLVMGVLPLPVFFMKIVSSWMVLYVVMYYGMLVIVNSNGN